MSIEDRDWYQQAQKDRERRAYGSSYQNSFGWYYMLGGNQFGPCDKDNIMRLLREHTLSASSLVKHEGLLEWTPIYKLSYEFPINGNTYVKNSTSSWTASTRNRRYWKRVQKRGRKRSRPVRNVLLVIGLLFLTMLGSGHISWEQVVNGGRTSVTAVSSVFTSNTSKQQDEAAVQIPETSGGETPVDILQRIRPAEAGIHVIGQAFQYGEKTTGTVKAGHYYFYDQLPEQDQASVAMQNYLNAMLPEAEGAQYAW